MSQFCVLVASSDSRKDIFDICFANSDTIWRDCDWPRYVGLTTPHPDQYGFKIITSPEKEWRKAVAAYVDALPKEIRYILLMVEDTLFAKPVKAELLEMVARHTANAAIKYMRLVPITRNWFGKLLVAMLIPRHHPYEPIPANNPYFSSTEMALWQRTYLRELLDMPVNAWEFEHLNLASREHWAVKKPVFSQNQIVQKGRWNRIAPRLLAQQGLSLDSKRPFQTRLAWLRGKWQNLNFALLGFTSVRIKKWLRP